MSESLAGRIGMLELTPFNAHELHRTSHAGDRWFYGGFPRVHELRGKAERLEWLDASLESFIQRDVPSFGYAIPPERLRKLLAMLAHVHGGILNVSDLARSLGVSSHTVAAHLDVLEGAFLIRRLQPHFANVKKRLVKSPKVYVRDTGLLHRLLELRGPEDLEVWPRRGQSFEGLVIEEICALARLHETRAHTAYWRTQAGAEVDLLVSAGPTLIPIEIKLGQQVGQYDIMGLRNCMKDLGLTRGFIVYGGTETFQLGGGIEVVPWTDVASRKVDFGFEPKRRRRPRDS